MKIIDTYEDILSNYQHGKFCLDKWFKYMDKCLPVFSKLCYDDMKSVCESGTFSFEKNYQPVLENLYNNKGQLAMAHKVFLQVTDNLEQKIINRFGRSLEVTIVFYLGLCNGAGWVICQDHQSYVLLGVEKIVELNWCDKDSMIGLIYHELGHVYQAQYGELEREYKSSEDRFMWQLFTEGIAMYFEQSIVGGYNYFHQDKDGWLDWCDNHLEEIQQSFSKDSKTMTRDNQCYFGDWVRYKNHFDVGYYLGARFIQYICKTYKYDEILDFNIDKVKEQYRLFCL